MSGPMQLTQNGWRPALVSGDGGLRPAEATLPIDDDDDDDPAVKISPVKLKVDIGDQSPAEFARKVKEFMQRAEPIFAPLAPEKPQNIVALAKKRLAEVKVELRRMKALEKERVELERLIDAAKNKPRAVIREIQKRSAG